MEIITKGGNYGDISLTGNGAHENNDTDILMMINAPGETVEINTFQGRDCWLPLWMRNVGKLTINNYKVSAFMNDGLHIRSSNVHIKNAHISCNIKKTYNDKNHPDNIQIFSQIPGESIGNIEIDCLYMFNRNTPEHVGVHLTEPDHYHDIYIGSAGITYDTDATTPFWFSANTLESSIIGHQNMSVSNKGIRILDVKNSGKSIDSVYLIGATADQVTCVEGFIDTRIYLDAFSQEELEAIEDLI